VNDGLSFISMIVGALEQPDSKFALRESLDRIKELGQLPGRTTAFRQFLRFMDGVAQEHSRIGFTEEPSVLHDVAASCVRRLTGRESDPEATETLGLSNPLAGQEIYERFCSGVRGATDRPSIRDIIVERNGVMIAGFSLGQTADTHTIHDVTLGQYRLCLESGRILWERELTDQDLVWSAAFPDRSLPAAADSGHSFAEPSHEASLIGDRFVLCVRPDVESGSIAIIWRGQETQM